MEHFDRDNNGMITTGKTVYVDGESGRTDDTYAPDAKGRKHVHTMTDRELAEETVTLLRATQDLVEGFMDHFTKSGGMGSIMSVMKMFQR